MITRDDCGPPRCEKAYGTPSLRHTLFLATKSAKRRDTNLTIISALIALLTDHVMHSVAATRRDYLAELDRYLDEQGFAQRPPRRRTSS